MQVLRQLTKSSRKCSPVHGIHHTSTSSIRLPRYGQLSYHSSRLSRYYRFESYETRQNIIYGIIGTNAAVYVLWQNRQFQSTMQKHFAVSAESLANFRLHTLITSCYSHASLQHGFFNMFTFYFFGGSLIHTLGTKRFLILYHAGGALSSLAQVQYDQYRQRHQFRRYAYLSLGASGAINSVIAYSILYAPTSTILLYGIVPVPAALFGLLFIGKDLMQVIDSRGTNVGHAAHLAGAFYGAGTFAYHKLNLRSNWRRLRR